MIGSATLASLTEPPPPAGFELSLSNPMEDHTHYIGRKYILDIRRSYRDTYSLRKDTIKIGSRYPMDPFHNGRILNDFYIDMASTHFHSIMDYILPRFHPFGIARPDLRIRSMNMRLGGSVPKSNRLYLNIDLIKTSRRCIEYMIAHELCHLVQPDHSNKFWKCMDRVMPDWRSRRMMLFRKIRDLRRYGHSFASV